jgi:hypothetical protein
MKESGRLNLLKQNRKNKKEMKEKLMKMAESVIFSLIMPGKMKKTEALIIHFRFLVQLSWVHVISWAEESSGDDGVECMNHRLAGQTTRLLFSA